MTYDPYKDILYIPCSEYKLTESEAAIALRNAWKRFYGNYPEKKQLALLFAQSALETGRWKIMRNYNFGNIKRSQGDGHNFTMFRCNEIIKGKLLWFNPPHLQTWFRAYLTAEDGVTDYLKFVATRERYKKAWHYVLEGNPTAYSHELKVANYYTANEELYTKGVVRITEEFKKNYDKLLAGQPIEKQELFTEEEKAYINGLIGITLDMSIEEYFANSNNMSYEEVA